MCAPMIYQSLERILDDLKKQQSQVEVTELLKIYNEVKDSYNNNKADENAKRHPLIILEGLDGSGKSTTADKLARKINGVKWNTPPKSISNLRPFFDEHSLLRTAYYSLGNYIAALEVALLLQETPVVMDRYWHSTCAYAVAQAVHDNPSEMAIPQAGNSIYIWPKDLMKPDIVLFLDVSEHVRDQRQSRRTVVTDQENLLKKSEIFRGNVILAYKNMVNPEIIITNANFYFNRVMKEILEKINHLL